MSPATFLFPTVLLLLAACSGTPAPNADAVTWRPVAPRASLVFDDERDSPNVPSSLAAGTRIQLTEVPRAQFGIPLPDGTCLPALNGVPRSGAVQRPAANGPVSAIVGIAVDESRLEWYEHQDGSMTTSRFVWNNQRQRWEPMTFHAVAAK